MKIKIATKQGTFLTNVGEDDPVSFKEAESIMDALVDNIIHGYPIAATPYLSGAEGPSQLVLLKWDMVSYLQTIEGLKFS